MSAEEDLASGALWRDFCRRLEAAGDLILGAAPAANELDRAEGFRYLTRLLRVALEMNLEWADPDFPGFYQASHLTAKIGADNPDNQYLNATVSGARRYRISGRLGTVPILTFGTKANRYAVDGTMASTGELAREEMLVGEDGSFEIILSKERPVGAANWLKMEDDTTLVVVRQTFSDRATQTPCDMRIAAQDGPVVPAPLSAAFLAAGLARTTGFVDGTARTFLRWAEMFRAEQFNRLATIDQEMFWRAGGDPMIFYLHGYWQLAENEALAIETSIPACRAWNFQLNNYWMESLDYRAHRIHVSNASARLNADGKVTVVVAARDPGFGNWIDTAGHSHGTMLWRWTGATEHPVPSVSVVKLP
jgi:hypothetical protein